MSSLNASIHLNDGPAEREGMKAKVLNTQSGVCGAVHFGSSWEASVSVLSRDPECFRELAKTMWKAAGMIVSEKARISALNAEEAKAFISGVEMEIAHAVQMDLDPSRACPATGH